MKLFEYQSKSIFSRYGIPVPKGRLAPNAAIANHIYEDLKTDVVIKAQVLAGGRGKAGGVRLAKNSEQVEEIATDILSLTIKGLPVKKILVEEAIKIKQEFFLAIITDKDRGSPVLMASKFGGVDIEEMAQKDSKSVFSIPINPLAGLQVFQIRSAALAIELPKLLWEEFTEITLKLWRLYQEIDADDIEINPLVISDGDKLAALDAKITVDDNALFRHPELTELFYSEVEDRIEAEAKKYGLAYVKLTGNIGCMVNGAGLAMATLDLLNQYGGKPANFLDIGGGASAERVAAGLKILLEDKRLKAILINIFGGITRCDEVARGFLTVLDHKEIETPIIIRLAGTNAKEGLALLESSPLIVAETLTDAVTISIQKAKGKNK
jgi:succinyl-CoA synthetase beta subunit